MLASAPKASAPNLNSVFSSDAVLLQTAAPSHWTNKNAVHWVLDEDDSRIRRGHHAQNNLAILRRLTLYLLRREKRAKNGIAAKRKRPGWKTDDLLKTFSHQYAYALT